MRVFIGPDAAALCGDAATTVARVLAGPGGDLVRWLVAGLRAPSRSLTAAEVHAMRVDLEGDTPGVTPGTVVGYVALGRPVGAAGEARVLAVGDHVGLTWESPLRGPNDERYGPRFPRTDQVYAPQVVVERFVADRSVTIPVATVAGVRDPAVLQPWEAQMVDSLRLEAVSAELVPVAVIAAHLGLRLAAAVIW